MDTLQEIRRNRPHADLYILHIGMRLIISCLSASRHSTQSTREIHMDPPTKKSAVAHYYARKLVKKYCPISATLKGPQARAAFEWISHSPTRTSTWKMRTRSIPQSLMLFYLRPAGIRRAEGEIGLWGGKRHSFYAKRNCNAIGSEYRTGQSLECTRSSDPTSILL